MQYLRSQDGGLKRDAVQTIQTQSRTRNVISHYALLALLSLTVTVNHGVITHIRAGCHPVSKVLPGFLNKTPYFCAPLFWALNRDQCEVGS
uniref:Uncharacterized protein n=1 Tax=Anguilla anguilla TaxID=7936 RepID=A0A0E9RV15_ANGAN